MRIDPTIGTIRRRRLAPLAGDVVSMVALLAEGLAVLVDEAEGQGHGDLVNACLRFRQDAARFRADLFRLVTV